MREPRGLLLVNTGDGKGKTTAAFGLAMRAVGHGMRVCVIQFIKGPWHSGEIEAARYFGDRMQVHVRGAGFTWQSEDLDEDIAIAREAWSFAADTIAADAHEMIVLDELTYLIKYGMVPEHEVLAVLSSRPAHMHVVVTGRDASEGLIALADTVTRMEAVKHPYDEGVKAQPGVEF
jgi:cob(I)alamin adenosyltransferase